jgi:hypothetical protein
MLLFRRVRVDGIQSEFPLLTCVFSNRLRLANALKTTGAK